MGEMLGVADERAFALADAKDRHADKVVERYGHDNQGHQNRIPVSACCFVVISCAKRQKRHDKTDDK